MLLDRVKRCHLNHEYLCFSSSKLSRAFRISFVNTFDSAHLKVTVWVQLNESRWFKLYTLLVEMGTHILVLYTFLIWIASFQCMHWSSFISDILLTFAETKQHFPLSHHFVLLQIVVFTFSVKRQLLYERNNTMGIR